MNGLVLGFATKKARLEADLENARFAAAAE
jgi:hypothetical protein